MLVYLVPDFPISVYSTAVHVLSIFFGPYSGSFAFSFYLNGRNTWTAEHRNDNILDSPQEKFVAILKGRREKSVHSVAEFLFG